ncbi:MAG: hypothetical protein C5B52_08685 [Bacteroidetes bacterium]|nr:MAG: hypothetical protein C5B52_08685 [Bacteroidota bacterium]
MSHFPQRKEKNCLNCSAEVLGRYCQNCGQENVEPKETVWHLVTHFFYDVTHFDGKFFSTVKFLLLKPGFLTAEYVKGKRLTYLHPIRMYVFTSAFFFLIFFSFIQPDESIHFGKKEERKKELASKKEVRSELKSALANEKDSAWSNAIRTSITKLDKSIAPLEAKVVADSVKDHEDDSTATEKWDSVAQKIPMQEKQKRLVDSAIKARKNNNKYDTIQDNKGFIKIFGHSDIQSREAYLMVQKELPDSARDSYFKRAVKAKMLGWQNKGKGQGDEVLSTVVEKFMHSFPQMLWVSLPLFALLLKFLYVRRKQFYYADHGIFSIHYYCAVFLMILIGYLFSLIHDWLGWWIFTWINVGIGIYAWIYLYKAMRNFYKQGRAKTIVKFFLLNMMGLVVMTILMTIFFIISAAKV